MNPMQPPWSQAALEELVTRINSALEMRADKDWNFSRISLHLKDLDGLNSAYCLWPEVLDLVTIQARKDLKTLTDEVKWGERHSSELGVLELVSLRVNKALLECTSDDYWRHQRPVIRLAKKDVLLNEGVHVAIWYEVREVGGEDFDSR